MGLPYQNKTLEFHGMKRLLDRVSNLLHLFFFQADTGCYPVLAVAKCRLRLSVDSEHLVSQGAGLLHGHTVRRVIACCIVCKRLERPELRTCQMETHSPFAVCLRCPAVLLVFFIWKTGTARLLQKVFDQWVAKVHGGVCWPTPQTGSK